ncbi:MAG TPA: glutamate-1-semialdehyde 2,1-aminomutase [Dehalococcoidia bacterium]|nr:glutamate-1-semialdehyde-2,1-aminomutase [Chloroflexota bacterium]MDP7160917.1 glutamate-1-semialdehyde 2,1-aminomutase [Dehalococcoidia bacterium]MDP7212969.1 glutamate-1-semialdehyde 2,1-aminomutase [Dehalococcoidia bacterium]HJM53527.1 glutamate-1-semialdehyde 2,1-aminomutase [Dehalococcoidia bacterium]
MDTTRSQELFDRARELIPGGVNSPARAWTSVGGTPLFFNRAKGSKIWDEDGNELIDYVCSWGPMILGHAHPAVLSAVQEAAINGTSFGAPTAAEVRMAELVVNAVPSIEMVRFVSSGTEATMSALRLARAYTGRNKIMKFVGGYHGHDDALLVSAGSAAAGHGIPDSAGVHPDYAKDTLVTPYNDLAGVEQLFAENPSQIACIIVEPIAGNMGVVPPNEGFLEGLSAITEKDGSLLIFDEVISGFRTALGGAQSIYGVSPDITCLGKIVGGGLPVGAYGGSKEIMGTVAPLGPMYQAGTLSGNPVAMAVGIAMLEELGKPGVYEELARKGAALEKGLSEAFAEAEVPARVNRVGSLLTVFFTGDPVSDMDSASATDRDKFARFFHAIVAEGVYPPPSQFEAWFVSLAHTDQDIAKTITAAKRALATL